MMTIAAIAGPRLISCFSTTGDVAVDGEKRFSGKPMRVDALKRVEFGHFGRLLPELHVVSTSFFARASPSPSLRFRVAALPEDDVAVEAAEVVDEPAVGAPAYEGPTVSVKFELQRECHFGQQFKVVGGDSQFGDWDPSAAVPLNWSEGHLWIAEVDVPEGKTLEYKYVLTDQEGVVEWQPGSNHVLETAAGAEPLVISEAWEETQPEPTAELEVQPAEPEVPPAEPEFQSAEPESRSAEPEVQSAESEVLSAEPDTGDWETFSADAEVRTPADALADAAASAAVGALNAGVKAATALEGGLDAVTSVSDSPSTETNGVAESKEKDTPTAIEIPVVDAALSATAEPAEPAEEPLNSNNGASIAASSQAESATTEEELRIEGSSMEAQPTRTEEQPTKEPKKPLNPFQKDIEWLSKTFFGR